MWLRGKRAILFGIGLLLALTVGVVGCGKQQTGQGQRESQPAQTEQKGKFPEKPIKMVLTHDVGSTVDTVGRTVAPYLEKYLGVPVVPENMPGAGGRKARAEVFKAAPDGYTILVSTMPSMQLGEILEGGDYKSTEFTHLYNFHGFVGTGIYVAKDSSLQTFDDFAKVAKAKTMPIGVPGGVGSLSDTHARVIANAMKVKFSIVPLQGTGEVVSFLLGKQVEAVIGDPSIVLRYPDKLRILAIVNDKRVDEFPGVPTMAELGYDVANLPFLVGVLGPPGMAPERAKTLESALDSVAKDPSFQDAFKKAGMILKPMTAAEYHNASKQIYEDIMKLKPVIEKAKAEQK